MLGFNKRRDRIYGPPDFAKSKEAGMQDKTEWENTVRLSVFTSYRVHLHIHTSRISDTFSNYRDVCYHVTWSIIWS